MKMEIVQDLKLVAPINPEHAVCSEDVPHMEKMVQLYEALKQDILQEDKAMLEKQIKKMKDFMESMTNIVNRINKQRVQCENTIYQLEKKTMQLQIQIKNTMQDSSNHTMQENLHTNIEQLKKDYLQECKHRINLSSSIDLKKLYNLNLVDRKSNSNEIFNWIMVTIYTEPESKFYWPNFKNVALTAEGAEDFKQRLGKISAFNITEEQKLKTEWLLQNFDSIKINEELVQAEQDITKIYEVAKIFNECNEIGKKIKQNTNDLSLNKEKQIEKDERLMKCKARYEALKERIGTNQDYLQILNNYSEKFQLKQKKYANVKEPKDMLANLQNLKGQKWLPTAPISSQSKQTCQQCFIF